MTHFRVEIQLPLYYNPKKGEKRRKEIPENLFYETYEKLLDIVGGINTSPSPILGAWKCPKTGKKFYDKSIVFTVLVKTGDRVTITNIPEIKKLIEYKEVLKEQFQQHEIFMVATRCNWL